jgi:hypothetical protein
MEIWMSLLIISILSLICYPEFIILSLKIITWPLVIVEIIMTLYCIEIVSKSKD